MISPKWILPFLALSIFGLLAGLWAGLLRMGWRIPFGSPNLPIAHGPLMVSGFLGTLIALERVAALKRKWLLAAPLLSGAGWVCALLFPATRLGAAGITLGSLGTVVILAIIFRREAQLFTGTMLTGALCWLAGNLLWLTGTPVYRLVFLWMGFLVLTVAGERLELSRVLRPTKLQYALFAGAAGLFLVGAAAAVWLPEAGARLSGAGLLALAAWLLRFDLARRNLKHPAPLTRYIAVCLFSGYVWLGFGGLISLAAGFLAAGPLYDAMLHSVLVGFIMAMIFGHAPIILPALLGGMLPFRRGLYACLGLLHISLVLRLAGDLASLGRLAGWADVRRWGGLLNETAILVFFGMVVVLVAGSRLKAQQPSRK